MSRWFRFYDTALDDPRVQRLRPATFKRALMAALRGEETPLSPYIRRGRDRTGPEWARLRAEIFERDDFTCSYCGERGQRLECDHILPLSRGGSDDLGNLTTACQPCNRSKRNKTPEEWLQ